MMKNRNLIYVILSVAALILNALPMMSGDAALTKYSIVSVAFAVGSVVYIAVAFIFRDRDNLFFAGRYWFYRALTLMFSENEAYTEKEEYKKEFELSAFVYCITTPTYVTLAFFATEFFSALSQALGWTVVRQIAIIIVVLIQRIKEIKRQRIREEAERKEQERMESMGKWK